MAYKIVYGPVPQERPSKEHTTIRLRTMTALFFLVGCLLIRTFWPAGTQLLRSTLLPGEPTVSEAAFQQMMLGFRSGEAFTDTVTVFCRTVLENEGLPQS